MMMSTSTDGVVFWLLGVAVVALCVLALGLMGYVAPLVAWFLEEQRRSP